MEDGLGVCFTGLIDENVDDVIFRIRLQKPMEISEAAVVENLMDNISPVPILIQMFDIHRPENGLERGGYLGHTTSISLIEEFAPLRPSTGSGLR